MSLNIKIPKNIRQYVFEHFIRIGGQIKNNEIIIFDKILNIIDNSSIYSQFYISITHPNPQNWDLDHVYINISPDLYNHMQKFDPLCIKYIPVTYSKLNTQNELGIIFQKNITQYLEYVNLQNQIKSCLSHPNST